MSHFQWPLLCWSFFFSEDKESMSIGIIAWPFYRCCFVSISFASMVITLPCCKLALYGISNCVSIIIRLAWLSHVNVLEYTTWYAQFDSQLQTGMARNFLQPIFFKELFTSWQTVACCEVSWMHCRHMALQGKESVERWPKITIKTCNKIFAILSQIPTKQSPFFCFLIPLFLSCVWFYFTFDPPCPWGIQILALLMCGHLFCASLQMWHTLSLTAIHTPRVTMKTDWSNALSSNPPSYLNKYINVSVEWKHMFKIATQMLAKDCKTTPPPPHTSFLCSVHAWLYTLRACAREWSINIQYFTDVSHVEKVWVLVWICPFVFETHIRITLQDTPGRMCVSVNGNLKIQMNIF